MRSLSGNRFFRFGNGLRETTSLVSASRLVEAFLAADTEEFGKTSRSENHTEDSEMMPDSDAILAQFNRLMQEVLRGNMHRTTFRPWEVELLLDIESCGLMDSSRRETLRRYQRAVQRPRVGNRVRGGESQSRWFRTNRPGFFERRPLRQIRTPLARSGKPSQPMHNFTIHDQCAKIVFYGNSFLNNRALIIDRRIGRK